MLHGFNFSKLVLLSTLIFTYWNACNSQLLQYQRPMLQGCEAHPIKLIAAWLVPDRAVKGKSQKGLKGNQGWEKLVFLKKTANHLFFVIFEKKQAFVLFQKNTKIHSELLIVFTASCSITSFRITHKITYYGIEIWGQRNIPYLCFCKGFLVNGKAWQERAQQTEKSHSHTNSAVSRQVCVHAQLVQHIYSAFKKKMVWYGPTSDTACM